MISLKQLEAVHWIATLGTFQSAANRLNTTQSAISKRVLELETVLGFAVFDRSQRRVRLTKAGEELILIAREMLELAAKANELNAESGGRARILRLGITELSAMTWLPAFIAAIGEDYPGTTVVADVDSARDLYDRLLDGALDIVVLPEFFGSSSTISIRAAEVDNVWVASPGLVQASGQLDLDTLSAQVMLMQSARSAAGSFYSRWLKSRGVTFERMISTDSLAAIASLAVAKLGIAILPRGTFSHLFDERLIVALDVQPDLPPLPYAVMFNDDASRAFVENMAQMILGVCSFERSILDSQSVS